MKMFKKRYRNYPVNQISENSKDKDNNQLSNVSEVLESRREAKRVTKNDEAIIQAEVSATQSGQRNEDLSIKKPVTAAPMDYSNQGSKKAMCDNNSGVGSSKIPNSD